MKSPLLIRLAIAGLLIFATFSHLMRAEEVPAECSVAAEMVNRLGFYKNELNALEVLALEEKGFSVVQGRVRAGGSEFRLQLFFHRDNLTRNVTITKNGRILFYQDYPPNPTSIGALKIFKTIPTCAELKAL